MNQADGMRLNYCMIYANVKMKDNQATAISFVRFRDDKIKGFYM